jgi:hypothetical protein
MIDPLEYEQLSLTARLAVALHCFARICESQALRHRAIDDFLNDLWEFPIIDNDRWENWEKNHPELVATALGAEFSDEFAEFLKNRGQRPEEFRSLISSVVEIVFSSFYGAADNALSMRFLRDVQHKAHELGIVVPPPAIFSQSLLADKSGWGRLITADTRDAWRNHRC